MGKVISGRPQLVDITPRSRRAVPSHQPPPHQQQATPAPSTAAAGPAPPRHCHVAELVVVPPPAPRRCHVAELMVAPRAAASASSQKSRPMTTSAARTTTSAGDVKVLPHHHPHQLKAKKPSASTAKVSSADGEKHSISSTSSSRNAATTHWTSLPVRARNSNVDDLSPPPPPKQKPVDFRDPDWMAKQGLKWEAHGLGILSAVVS